MTPGPAATPIEPYYVAVARGEITGMSLVRRFGRAQVQPRSMQDVWDLPVTQPETGPIIRRGSGTGVRTDSTTPERVSIVSTSLDDTALGSGARTVILQGLDGNHAPLEETVTLAGTTPVAAAANFLRVWRAYVNAAGASNSNDGDILISGANPIAKIAAGEGQTFLSHYTVQDGVTAYLVKARFNAASRALLRLLAKPPGGAWYSVEEYYVSSDNPITIDYPAPVAFSEHTDIKWTVQDLAPSPTTSAESINIYIHYDIMLEAVSPQLTRLKSGSGSVDTCARE